MLYTQAERGLLSTPPPQPSIDACFSVSDVCLCSTIIIVVIISLHSIYSINNADANHMFTHVLRSAWLLLLLRTQVALLQALINFVSKICHTIIIVNNKRRLL